MSDETHAVTVQPQAVLIQSPLHPALERVLAAGPPTPETLAKLLDLQREWEKDEARRAYTLALVQLRRSLPPVIARDATVDYTGAKGRVRYTHASLAAAMEAIQGPLTDCGFAVSWRPETPDGGKVKVRCVLTHRMGHSEEATISAPPDTSGAKSPPQAVASTITLLERYTLLALLGIATADMVEPHGGNGGDAPGESDAVDAGRNLRAVEGIIRAGRTREEAERMINRPVSSWSVADLGRLRAWLGRDSAAPPLATAGPEPAESPAPAPEPEPQAESAAPPASNEWAGIITEVIVRKPKNAVPIYVVRGLEFEALTRDEAIAVAARTAREDRRTRIIRFEDSLEGQLILELRAAEEPEF